MTPTVFLDINSQFMRWKGEKCANNTQCLIYISLVSGRHAEGQAHSVVTE